MNYELYALDFGGGKGKLGIMKDLSPALTTTHAGAPVVNQTVCGFDSYNLSMTGDVVPTITVDSGSRANGARVLESTVKRFLTEPPIGTLTFGAHTSSFNGQDATANRLIIGECEDTMIVRRLTPKECERLQGYPDGWTEGESDTQRYKQCGNSVAVPCVEFLMQGISEVLKSYDDD